MAIASSKSTPSRYLSHAQLESLWIQAGGNPNLSDLMAAIAQAESGDERGGDPTAHNFNPKTGDDSYGLWQINYAGDLAQSRTIRYGTTTQIQSPLTNAKAAVDLAGSKGQGIESNWRTTVRNQSFVKYLRDPRNAKINVSANFWGGGVSAPQPPNPKARPFNPPSTSSGIASLLGLSDIGKNIMYSLIIGGGGLLILLGFLMIGADLGLAAFAGMKKSSIYVVTSDVVNRRANSQAQSNFRESRAATGGPAKEGTPRVKFEPDKKPKRGTPGSSKLAPGDSIPF